MSEKKLPETDDERLNILRTALEQEETIRTSDKVLSIIELQDLRVFIANYERANTILNHATMDRTKAKNLYDELFKNAQLYVSHFIQVLFLSAIRNEIRTEYLPLYGFQENSPSLPLPNLSTEEAVLSWAEKLMQGETERTYRGGIPLYNPAIAKVKVHYELFKEAAYSLSIYEKNIERLQNNMPEIRKKADELIVNIWTKVEERYSRTSPEEQSLRFKAYKIQSIYRKGDQLSVFD